MAKDTWQVYMNGGATSPYEYYFIQALYQNGMNDDAERLLWPLMQSYEKGTFNAGIELPGQRQRNPVGSAFYTNGMDRAAGAKDICRRTGREWMRCLPATSASASMSTAISSNRGRR